MLGWMEMEDPVRGGTRLFLTVSWVQSSREFRGRSWSQCECDSGERGPLCRVFP